MTNVVNNANVYLAPTIQIPSALEITAITQANPMVVSTTANSDQVNTYIPGQMVLFQIPYQYGMWQLNGQYGQIISISGNDFTFNIDSRNYDPFSIPGSNLQGASFAPSGSRNLSYSNITNQIGFQSLNNTGN